MGATRTVKAPRESARRSSHREPHQSCTRTKALTSRVISGEATRAACGRARPPGRSARRDLHREPHADDGIAGVSYRDQGAGS